MWTLDELQEEYDAACIAEDQARREGRVTASIMRRRDAATRRLHAAEDPWMECECFCCADTLG